MFFNEGDAVVVGGDSAIQISHATLDNNTGRADVGQDSSTLFMFNRIAWENSGGGISIFGTGPTTTCCNFDQPNVAGPNIDPLLVTNADGLSHLSLDSPAVDACFNFALRQFDREGRNRVFNFAPDAGVFEGNDILFRNGFE